MEACTGEEASWWTGEEASCWTGEEASWVVGRQDVVAEWVEEAGAQAVDRPSWED